LIPADVSFANVTRPSSGAERRRIRSRRANRSTSRVVPLGESIACIYNLEVRIGSKVSDGSVVSGEPPEIVERLLGLLQPGLSGMNFIVGAPNAPEQRERLATEVLPALQAAA
jgi:alkanesulfonate monooxygenase SsuD/methylene tetrahydromethanopterin reductase-like flavin-dependent oxidoreductase (luciferase family)